MWYIILQFLIQGMYTANYTTRIIGGKETTIENFPYQIMVLCQDTFTISLCGGALINKRSVLTAAHCVYDCNADNLIIIAGSSELDQGDKKYQHRVDSVTIHQDFEDGQAGNDIAVICLKSTLRYSSRIQPIPITDQLFPEGTNATISGWGRISNGQVSRKLRYANVKLINNRHCKLINPLIDETQLCTNGDGVGPCKGDSGGPLVTHKKLIGLVSYGDIDCTSKTVRMYTNVYHFGKFVEDNLC